jgi:hypothetical protein
VTIGLSISPVIRTKWLLQTGRWYADCSFRQEIQSVTPTKESSMQTTMKLYPLAGIALGTWLALTSLGCATQQPQSDPWASAAQQASSSASRAEAAAGRAETAVKRAEGAIARVESAASRIEAASARIGSPVTEQMRK